MFLRHSVHYYFHWYKKIVKLVQETSKSYSRKQSSTFSWLTVCIKVAEKNATKIWFPVMYASFSEITEKTALQTSTDTRQPKIRLAQHCAAISAIAELLFAVAATIDFVRGELA